MAISDVRALGAEPLDENASPVVAYEGAGWSNAAARLIRSSALRTAVVYGTAGAAFAGANLLLARSLPVAEYAIVALVIAFFNFSIPVGPLGADGVVNRSPTRVGGWLLARALLTAVPVAIAATLVAGLGYRLSGAMLLALLVAITAGGTNYLAAAHFQSQQRFAMALGLVQGANVALLAAAGVVLYTGSRRALVPIAVLASWHLLAAVVGWWRLLRSGAPYGEGERHIPWREAISLVSVSGAVILLGQLERFVLPAVLDLGALATFGVLAAIVGSIFRILLLGVGFSLLPRLRAAPDVRSRHALVSEEALAVSAIVLTASVALWFVTPWLVDRLLAGKYALPPALIAASLAVGWVKVAGSFARTIVVALGSPRELRVLSWGGWAAVVLAVVGMWIGAGWGLTGVVVGAGLGWVGQSVVAGIFAVRLMPFGPEHEAPRVSV